MKSYQTRPDVFELVVNSSFVESLEIKQLETPWGLDQSQYCYFKKILIGEVVNSANESTSFYRSRGIQFHSRLVINLTPNLEYNSLMKFPMANEFVLALEELLLNSNGWVLLCESNCDQHFIEKVEPNSDRFLNNLNQLKKLFLGESSDCPTFITEAKE